MEIPDSMERLITDVQIEGRNVKMRLEANYGEGLLLGIMGSSALRFQGKVFCGDLSFEIESLEFGLRSLEHKCCKEGDCFVGDFLDELGFIFKPATIIN